MKSVKVFSFLGLLLVLLAPFVQSDTSDVSQSVYLNHVPSILSEIASVGRWGILILLSIYGLLSMKSGWFTKFNAFFLFFFGVLALYAIVSNTDLNRYILIFYFVLTVPVAISKLYGQHYFNVRNLRNGIAILLLLSVFVSIGLVFRGLRFQGVLGNSNMFGITAVFWTALYLLEMKEVRLVKLDYLVILFLVISIILSGSRGALVAAFFVLIFGFVKYIKIFFISSISLVGFFSFFSRFVDFSFILTRFENIGDSARDSGRQEVWDRAFSYIKINAWGWGMDAPLKYIDTGNVHNGYIRLLLTTGYFFTFCALIAVFLITYFLVFNRKIPKVLFGFWLGYLFANFGEDFFVGLGSSMFVYVLYLIGMISFYSKSKNESKGTVLI